MNELMEQTLGLGMLAEDALDRASEARGFIQQQAFIAGANWYSLQADRHWREAIKPDPWHLTANDRLFS